MPNPAPLAELLARLPFDKLRAFLQPRLTELPWSMPQRDIATLAAPRLLTTNPWDELSTAFPSFRTELAAVRERCTLDAPAAPPPSSIHIGSISHVQNLAIGTQGDVVQTTGELAFQLSRSGPVDPLRASLGNPDVWVAALAECRDPAIRERLYAEADKKGIRVRWDVFCAYATPDRTHADTLVAAIERRGPSVFLDHTCIPAGALWGAHLQSAILGAKVIVVLLSGGVMDRPYLMHEIQLAVEVARAGTTLIPVWVDAPGTAPYGLGAYQALTLQSGVDIAAGTIATRVLAVPS